MRAAVCSTCLVALTVCVAGCGGTRASGSRKKTIFVFDYFPHSVAPTTWEWYNGYEQAAARLRARFNVVVKEEGSVDEDPAQFLEFIKTAMVEQPDGVVVVPNNGVAMAYGLRRLEAQYPKVKFLAMDSPVPNWNGVSFVGTNNFAAGERAAKWLVGEYHQRRVVSTQVAVFRAPPGVESQDQRVAGFVATIRTSPLKVVQTVQSADVSTSTALTSMTDVLTTHPHLGAVFSSTDSYGIGVAGALAKARRLNIVDVAIDAATPAVEAIIHHDGMNAEIAQHFKDVGYQAVLTLAEALEGKAVPRTIYIPTTLVTARNAQVFLKEQAVLATPTNPIP